MGLELFSVSAYVTLDDSEFNTGIGRAESRGQSFASKLGGAIAKGALVVKGALVGIGAGAIAVGNQFEQSMNSIGVTTGMTQSDIESLSMTFRDFGLDGVFSANQIASAYNYVARAGETAEQATALMTHSMNLAQATGNDLGRSTYFLSNYLLKMGRDATEAEGAVDIFVHSINKSSMSLADMERYVFRMTPAFQQMGASTETNVAIMTQLYSVGVRNASLYSGMGGIMQDFAVGGDFATAAMERFNVSQYDAYGNLRASEDLMFDVAKAMYAYGDAAERGRFKLDNLTQVQQDAWFEFMRNAEVIRNEIIPGFYNAGSAAEQAGEKTLSFNQALGVASHSGQDMLKTVWGIISAPLANVLGRAAEKTRELALRLREGGDLHPIVEQLGEAIARLGEFVVNLATRAIEPTIRALTFFARGLTTALDVVTNFTPSVLAVVAAFKLWKPALAIHSTIQRVTTAIKSMTGVVKAHAAAQNISAASAAHLANADRMRRQAAEQTKIADAAAASAARNRQKAEYHLAIAKKGGAGADAHRAKAAALSKKADMDSITAGVARKKVLNSQTAAANLDTKAQIANTGALKVGTVAKGLAATAQAKLNMLWKTNPIGIVIAGVAALAAGIMWLVNVFNRETEASKAIRQETERLVAAREESARSVERVTSAVRASAEAHENRISNIEAESSLTNSLIDDIERLNEVNNKSAAERNQLSNAVERLNEHLGEAVFTIDAETGAINENTSAIRRRLNTASGEEQITAIRQRQNELFVEQIELESEISRVNDERMRKLRERAYLETQIAELVALTSGPSLTSRQEYFAELRALNEQLDKLNYSIEQSRYHYYNLSGDLENVTTSYAAFADQLEYTTEVMSSLNYEMQNYATVSTETIKEMVMSQTEALQTLASIYESVRDRATDAFSQMGMEVSKTLEEKRDTLLENARITAEWGTNIRTIMDAAMSAGVDDGVLAHLLRMAEKGPGYAAAMANDIEFTLNELAPAAGEAIGSVEQYMVNRFNASTEALDAVRELIGNLGHTAESAVSAAGFDQIGVQIPTDVASGITSAEDFAISAAESMSESTLGIVNSIFGKVNPLMEFVGIGQNVPTSIGTGIRNRTRQALDAMWNFGNNFLNKAKNMLNFDVFKGIGINMIDGLVNAIYSGIHRVVSAVTTMAEAAVQAAMNALDIRSPSGKFEYMGDMSIEGYIKSMLKGVGKVKNVVKGIFDFNEIPSIQGYQLSGNATMIRPAQAQQQTTGGNIGELHLHINNEMDLQYVLRMVDEYLRTGFHGALRARGVTSYA